MSMSLILVPIAIAIFVTASETADQISNERVLSNKRGIEGIQTKYVSAELLKQTLIEHGVSTEIISENCIIADFLEGRIEYYRMSLNDPFKMNISNIQDAEAVICNVRMIEAEYHSNVQTYSYNRLIKNLPDNMSIETEEILEDNSILITLSVD